MADCRAYLTVSGDSWSSIIFILCGAYFDGNAAPTSHSSGGNNCNKAYKYVELNSKENNEHMKLLQQISDTTKKL